MTRKTTVALSLSSLLGALYVLSEWAVYVDFVSIGVLVIATTFNKQVVRRALLMYLLGMLIVQGVEPWMFAQYLVLLFASTCYYKMFKHKAKVSEFTAICLLNCILLTLTAAVFTIPFLSEANVREVLRQATMHGLILAMSSAFINVFFFKELRKAIKSVYLLN